MNLLVGADQEKWVTTEMEDDLGDSFLTYGMYNDWFRRYASDGYINYNKAYLKIPSGISVNAKELGFEEQEEPDISHVSITELIPSTNTKLYDLNGVQVTKPKKGIYISNGKKFSFIR